MRFTNEQMQNARKTDLYEYLMSTCPDRFKREGDSLRPKDNHSVSIKRGYSGYMDFANGETGNSVDYLVRHMGFDVISAVNALAGTHFSLSYPSKRVRQISHPARADPDFPEPENSSFRQLFAYLHQRGISYPMIQKLVDEKRIYQYADTISGRTYHNMLFINPERDFGEKHGTISYGTSFHGVVKNARSDGFWWFKTGKNISKAYICEAAIDAISLSVIKQEPACYISIAGSTGKQKTIDRIKRQAKDTEIILAVDNDDAGDVCRKNNKDLFSIIPVGKDWNEDLQRNFKNVS